ncbi:MAG: aminotransferase class V-fold PLP-dependent enzyme, partial [Planctomycetota bacterium]
MSPHALDSRSGEGVGRSYDPDSVRADFPALHQEIHGHPLVYLDSAASAQKPRSVLDAMDRLYREDYANVHRGVHTLSERSTRAYEGARDRIRDFIGAEDSKLLVFVRGTTEAVNLVAQSFGRPRLSSGDVILLTELEHHSNIVPWQLVADQTGARIEVVPISDDGSVQLEAFTSRLNDAVKFASFSHVSNALGTVLPVKEMVAAAQSAGVPTMIDGAQATPHLP